MTVLERLFSEGFRIFFLASAAFAVLAIGVWEAVLLRDALGLSLPTLASAAGETEWHAHEMIFGFAGAALGGFFLTAVPNWTGARAARHLFIGTVFGLWLIGRLAVWFSALLPAPVVAIAALAFLPVLGAKIAAQLVKRPKPQNVMFLGILALLWIAELLVQADWMGLDWGDAWLGLRGGLLAICALIAVLGGRITPAFTRNAMTRMGIETGLPDSRKPLELLGIASAMSLPLAVMLGLPASAVGALACVSGLATLARLALWRGLWTRPFPILWTMHLSYGALGLGYLAYGAAQLGLGNEISALHILGIGAVGGMVLSVMSRASLGHTGRPLIAPRPVALAYALVPVAAVLRWSDTLWPEAHLALSIAAGLVWLVAFGLALSALFPILSAPRLPRPDIAVQPDLPRRNQRAAAE